MGGPGSGPQKGGGSAKSATAKANAATKMAKERDKSIRISGTKREDHLKAANAHKVASEAHKAEGNQTAAEHHEKMGQQHLRIAGGGPREIDGEDKRPQEESRVPTPRSGPYERGSWDEAAAHDTSARKAMDASSKAAAASKAASSSQSVAAHDKAAGAHDRAAQAHEIAGNKLGAEHHEKMRDRHDSRARALAEARTQR